MTLEMPFSPPEVIQQCGCPGKRHDFTFRLGSQDYHIFREVVAENCYRITPGCFTRNDVIVDVGANIGTFALTCLWSGAGKVICYEPDADNARLLRKNLEGYPACVVHEMAIWRTGVETVKYTGNPRLSAEGHCLGESGVEVKARSLDEALIEAGEVRLLKMDCEGAEWPALYCCAELRRVSELIVEVHPAMANPAWPWDCTTSGMMEHLEGKGFGVELVPGVAPTATLFARRKVWEMKPANEMMSPSMSKAPS